MTDKRLVIFETVVECGGFTAAARRLKMSQPAVSQSVAQTEAEVGGELLVRGSNPLRLTDKGRVFHAYAIRILSLYDSLNAEISDSSVSAVEKVRLDLGDGRVAGISVSGGKIEIEILDS